MSVIILMPGLDESSSVFSQYYFFMSLEASGVMED